MSRVQTGLLWIVACAVFALPALSHAVGPDWKVVTDSPKAFAKQAAEVRRKIDENAAATRLASAPAPVKAEMTALNDTPKSRRR